MLALTWAAVSEGWNPTSTSPGATDPFRSNSKVLGGFTPSVIVKVSPSTRSAPGTVTIVPVAGAAGVPSFVPPDIPSIVNAGAETVSIIGTLAAGPVASLTSDTTAKPAAEAAIARGAAVTALTTLVGT